MQALASQAKSHTEALGQLTQQHQDACCRLAAASSERGELRQQLARAQQENQQLQQQARQLQQQVQQVGLFPALRW
jgi:chromosome segregation ATPase